jgi:hypothetical protein
LLAAFKRIEACSHTISSKPTTAATYILSMQFILEQNDDPFVGQFL